MITILRPHQNGPHGLLSIIEKNVLEKKNVLKKVIFNFPDYLYISKFQRINI